MSSYIDTYTVGGRHHVHHHRRHHAGGRRRVHRGGFGWGDVWDGVKSVGRAIGGPVHDIVKKTGLIGKALSYVPIAGPALGTVARAVGYGRRRRRHVYRGRRVVHRRRRHGGVRRVGGFRKLMSVLRAMHARGRRVHRRRRVARGVGRRRRYHRR